MQSLDELCNDFVTFMLNFYEEFTVYKTRDLVITGESFAGKYLSYSSRAILQYNTDVSNDFDAKLHHLCLHESTGSEKFDQKVINDLSSESSDSKEVQASGWYYYSVPADQDMIVQITSDRALEIYVKLGHDDIPDPQTFDSIIKNQS